jgi:hypothetical protein
MFMPFSCGTNDSDYSISDSFEADLKTVSICLHWYYTHSSWLSTWPKIPFHVNLANPGAEKQKYLLKGSKFLRRYLGIVERMKASSPHDSQTWPTFGDPDDAVWSRGSCTVHSVAQTTLPWLLTIAPVYTVHFQSNSHVPLHTTSKTDCFTTCWKVICVWTQWVSSRSRSPSIVTRVSVLTWGFRMID